ncbi:GGDEF domain-containing protein [Marinomonas pollencensis]|uniref:diguanylate cyclase n=1 Tax=Marinomonas pollencensis TaxID=491954 RepID=A0A3E0DG00_9GAMM|nr:GGDEF domain-containing protein [Marinomonas pollencensis]REG81603.1 diguanylate cyclase (GGDEF)-like protein [Marinomonas pollencensis]
MVSIEQMAKVLEALPDPVFVLSRSGRYVAVFGGHDTRYYHSAEGLVGLRISDIVSADKADWFLEQIAVALEAETLLIREYELSIREVGSDVEEGPVEPIWFEGRIQKLDFQIAGEDVVLWMASNITERHKLEAKLRKLSDTDKLTGLFNRRRLERELKADYRAFIGQGVPTSIVIFDLDNLKTINDTLGHYVGDEVIVAIANICRNELADHGIACRYGGDEFVVALFNAEVTQAKQFADRLHEKVMHHFQQFFTKNLAASIGISVGISGMLPDDTSYKAVLKRADDALYQAKRSGKNKTIVG